MARIGSIFINLQMNAASIDKELKKTRRDINKWGKDVKKSLSGLEGAFKLVSRAAAGLFAGAALLQATKMIDAYNVLQSRVKNATSATGDFVAVFRELTSLSKQTGAQLETSVSLFQRLALGARELGKSNQDVIQLVGIVEKLGVIGGSSNQALQAGLLQFGQAMSAGIVRAEEFNSIVENLPELANRIAKGLGTTTGQLRKMVLEGKVLSKDVFEALIKQSDNIQSDFEKMPNTIARSWSRLTLTVTEALKKFDEGTSFSRKLADMLDDMARSVDSAKNNLGFLIGPFNAVSEAAGNATFAVSRFLNEMGKIPEVPKALEGALKGIAFGASSVGAGVESATTLTKGIVDTLFGRRPQAEIDREATRRLNEIGDRLSQQFLDFFGPKTPFQKGLPLVLDPIQKRGVSDKPSSSVGSIGGSKGSKKEMTRLKSLLNGLKPAAQKVREEIAFLNEMFAKGAIKDVAQYNEAMERLDRKLKNSIILNDKRGSVAADLKKLLDKTLKDPVKKFTDELENSVKPRKEFLGYLETLNNAIESTKTPAEALAENIRNIREAGEFLGKSDEAAQAIQRMRFEFEDTNKKAKEGLEDLIAVTRRFGRTFEDTFIDAFKTGQFAFKDMLGSMLEDLARFTLRASVLDPIGKGLGGLFSGAFSNFGSRLLGSFTGGVGVTGPVQSLFPRRADGGSVRAMQPAIVGERGPELFLPGQNGTIIPNKNLGGGGVTLNQFFTINATDSRSFEDRLAEHARFIGNMSVRAVQDAHNRRGNSGPMDSRRGRR